MAILAESQPEAGPSRLPRYRLVHSISAHTCAVTCVKISNDGKVLVSAGADGYLHLWDLLTGEHIRSIRAHRTGINDISLSPDSLYIATASDDSTIQIHSLSPLPFTSSQTPSRSKPLRTLSSHTAPVLSVSFSPKSNLLVTGSIDESAIIWDVRRGTVIRSLPAHSDAVWSVGWDGEGGMVLTGSADGLIRLWDTNTGQCLKTLDNDTNSPVSYASITPSSFFLLSSTLSSTLRVYNMYNSKVVKTLRAPGQFISEKFPCPAVIFEALPLQNSPDSLMEVDEAGQGGGVRGKRKKQAWIASGSENGKVVIWDLASKRVVQVLDPGQSMEGDGEGEDGVAGRNGNGIAGSSIVAIAVSPDGRSIVTGSLEPERVIRIWRDDT